MQGNQFGKTSKLTLSASEKEGKTILDNVVYTSPFKIMRPFPQKDGGIRVMLLAASAGIMEGDRQEFSFHVGPGAKMQFESQSFDKIHFMKDGMARRYTKVEVDAGGEFLYFPQPVIPFEGSAFENEMEIYLEDETAGFGMAEILSCGRYARGEAFQYRFFRNLIKIYRKDKFIYCDNARYEPDLFDMKGLGMFESFSHLASLFLSQQYDSCETEQKIQRILDEEKEVEGAITRLPGGGLVIRIFGHRAQKLEMLAAHIFSIFF